MSSRKQASAYCFTLNNYTTAEVDYLKALSVKYMVFGMEEAPSTGTPHLQGYVVFPKKKEFNAVVKLLPRCHLTVARGNAQQNYDYCTKEEVPSYEKGERPTGSLGDINAKFVACVRDHLLPPDEKVVKHGGIYIRYKKNIDAVGNEILAAQNKQKLRDQFEDAILRPYQEKLFELLVPDDRTILWVYDKAGNMGKTWMSKYIQAKLDGIRFTNAKTADICYAYNGERYVVFDFSRSSSERINYDVIEQIKNRMLFSGKYESCSKLYPDTCCVVCFANDRPDKSKMSLDRWRIIKWASLKCKKAPITYSESMSQTDTLVFCE